MESKSTQPSSFHLGYRPALDGIRGFAVLWVIGFHFNLPLGRDGLFGVDMFFVLSGFLITILLVEEWEREGKVHFKNFYLRRILRLYPALLLLLIALCMIAPWPYIISTLFYFTNWVKALHLQPDSLFLDHTWSLSIEEQYYILWPIALTFLLKMKIHKRNLFLLPLLLGLASAIARGIYWIATEDWFRVYMGTDLHADGLLIGSSFGLMTMYSFYPNFSKHKLIISLTTVITFLFIFWLLIEKELTSSFIPLYGNLGISLGTIIIISRLIHFPSPFLIKIFSFSPLVKIGMISYGLYLWHAPVGVVIDQVNFNLEPFLISMCKIIATFLAAGLSYFLVEKPFLKLKDRFISKQSSLTP